MLFNAFKVSAIFFDLRALTSFAVLNLDWTMGGNQLLSHAMPLVSYQREI